MNAFVSFDRAPDLGLPARYFAIAPWYLAAFGLLLLVLPQIDMNRWSPAVLGLTHLLMLGFMGNIMLGAVIQMAAVVAGVPVEKHWRYGKAAFWGFQIGVVSLVTGLTLTIGHLLQIAGILLLLSLAPVVVRMGFDLLQAEANDPTTKGMKFAVSSLIVTLSLGFLLTLWIGWGVTLPAMLLLGLHIVWGLMPWVFGLIVAVAYTVVPMFHLSPVVPRFHGIWWHRVFMLCVVIWSAAWVTDWSLRWVVEWGMIALIWLASLLLVLGLQRARRKLESTRQYWWLSLVCVLCSTVWYLVGDRSLSQWPLVLFYCWVWGGMMSVLMGMLLKIVPFLCWLHSRKEVRPGVKLPDMKHYLGDEAVRRQWLLQLLTLVFGGASLLLESGAIRLMLGILINVSALHLLAVIQTAFGRYYAIKQSSRTL